MSTILPMLALAAQLPVMPLPPGKVAMVFLSHHDDHTWQYGFGGTIARMTSAGYTITFCRATNDEKDVRLGWGQNDQINLKEAREAVGYLGIKEVLSLNWRNDHMDSVPLQELRAQMILLIRKYRPDVVMSWNPWGHYDRNPDHRKVGRAIGEAVWMAGLPSIHPEHAELGLRPHRVPHLLYTQRSDYGKGHEPNVAIEFGERELEAAANAYWAHKNVRYDPAGARHVRQMLDAKGLRIPELDGLSDEQANEWLEKELVRSAARRRGKQVGVRYAEVFRYLDDWRDLPGLRDYIAQSAAKK